MLETNETEIIKNPEELFEIEINPTNEQVNTFSWIRNHPGVNSYCFTDVDGNSHNYTYTLRDSESRYKAAGKTPKQTPQHIRVMEDKKTGRLVVAKNAVKKIGGSWFLSTNIPEEAHKTGVYEHPYIATVFDLAADDEKDLYLIMEYLPNGDLERWKKNIHNTEEIGQLMEKLSSALNHIHTKKRLVFADMKPLNVCFDTHWNPKIIDLEISQQLGRNGAANNQRANEAYEAPEQQAEELLSVRTDIYSLGATMFSVFAQEPENYYERKGFRATFENNPNSLIPFKTGYKKIISENQKNKISSVLHKALSAKPDDRYSSVLEFNKNFQDAIVV